MGTLPSQFSPNASSPFREKQFFTLQPSVRPHLPKRYHLIGSLLLFYSSKQVEIRWIEKFCSPELDLSSQFMWAQTLSWKLGLSTHVSEKIQGLEIQEAVEDLCLLLQLYFLTSASGVIRYCLKGYFYLFYYIIFYCLLLFYILLFYFTYFWERERVSREGQREERES